MDEEPNFFHIEPFMNQSKTSIWLWTIGAFFAFFVFGFTDNLKGATIPALLQDLHISYSLGGTILLGVYIGFMAATLTTGLIADTVGKKFVLLLAGICLAIGISGYSTFTTPVTLVLSMTVLGFGLGALELGCNALIVELHPSDKGRYLNLMSVMHGMGSMIAPLFAGWLLAANTSWRIVYRWDFLPIGLLIVYFGLAHYPKVNNAQSEKIDFKHLGKTAFTTRMMWFYTAILFYVATELGIASWVVEFLQTARSQSVTQSTQALSAFFGLMMVGRFLGSFVVERFGYLKSILVATLAACACIAIGLFGPDSLSFALPISGFFLSIIFPTITAAASDGHNENTNTILGLLFTFAGLGGMIGPWSLGVASDLLGSIGAGFSLNLIFGLLTALAAFVLLRRNKIPG
jgi:fucose permease